MRVSNLIIPASDKWAQLSSHGVLRGAAAVGVNDNHNNSNNNSSNNNNMFLLFTTTTTTNNNNDNRHWVLRGTAVVNADVDRHPGVRELLPNLSCHGASHIYIIHIGMLL